LVRPHLLDQLVLGDNPVAVLEKIAAHLKDLGLELSGPSSPLQAAERRIKHTVCKDIDHHSPFPRISL